MANVGRKVNEDDFSGTPGRIRTDGLNCSTSALYPSELRGPATIICLKVLQLSP